MTTDAEFERVMNLGHEPKKKKAKPQGQRKYKTNTEKGNRFEDTMTGRRSRLDKAIDGE